MIHVTMYTLSTAVHDTSTPYSIMSSTVDLPQQEENRLLESKLHLMAEQRYIIFRLVPIYQSGIKPVMFENVQVASQTEA